MGHYDDCYDVSPEPFKPTLRESLNAESKRLAKRLNPPSETEVIFMTNQVHHMCVYLELEEVNHSINGSWFLYFTASTGKFEAVLRRDNPKRVPADFSTKEHTRALKGLYEDLYKMSKEKALQRFLDLELHANNIHRMP